MSTTAGPRPSAHLPFWARAKKFGVACVGALGQVATQGLIDDPWAGRVAIALALATAFGVYGVRNAQTRPLEDYRVEAVPPQS